MSEKIEPCPYCGSPCTLNVDGTLKWVECEDTCQYFSGSGPEEVEVIAAHNQLCRRVKLGEMAEEFARTECSEPKGCSKEYCEGYCHAWWTAQGIFQYAIESENAE